MNTVRSDNLAELTPSIRRIVDGRIALGLAYVNAMLAAEQRKSSAAAKSPRVVSPFSTMESSPKPIEEVMP